MRHFNPSETPVIIWADHCFGEAGSKTATGVICFGDWPVTAVIDYRHAGQSVRQVTQLLCDAPIVADLETALAMSPKAKAFMIGTAPPGGGLPEDCRQSIKVAIKAGLHIINGLHVFLKADPELSALAAQHQVTLWDVRDWPRVDRIAHQYPRPTGKQVVSVVGSDCSVGKMFTGLTLHQAALSQGISSAFLATGQTGMMITGNGIPLDSLVGDFMAGTVEASIENLYSKADVIWVEGQGSLFHPAYSGVTLALLHGACPDSLVLCYYPDATHIRHYAVPIPPLTEVITCYEQAAAWARPENTSQRKKPKVIGISVNTAHLSNEIAIAYIGKASDETGLPVTDPVRYGVEGILSEFRLSI